MGHAGSHEGLQVGSELLGPLLQPGLGVAELQAAYQGRLFVCIWGLLPLGQFRFQLLAAQQVLPGFVQPALQQRPLAQQGLMRHLHPTLLVPLFHAQ